MSDHYWPPRDVKARKEHKCFGCLLPIPKGTMHTVQDTIQDCGFFSYRLCNVCETYWAEGQPHFGDTFGKGELIQSDQEGWEEVRDRISTVDGSPRSTIEKGGPILRSPRKR